MWQKNIIMHTMMLLECTTRWYQDMDINFYRFHTLRLMRFWAGFKGAVLGLLWPDTGVDLWALVEFELEVGLGPSEEEVEESTREFLPSCLRFLFISVRNEGLGLRLGNDFFFGFLWHMVTRSSLFLNSFCNDWTITSLVIRRITARMVVIRVINQ